MSIEKSLYAAPMGLDREMSDEIPDIEILIEAGAPMDSILELEDGGVEVTFGEDVGDGELAGAPFDTNLAELLSEDVLSTLSSDLMGLVDADITSRQEWADTYAKGLELVGFKHEERTRPWEGACGVHSTVLSEAVIRFQAETMSETFPAAGPVRVKIIGEETQEKMDAGERVKADMNYELTENMVEYRPEHERMLYSLGLAGSAFKKVYYDPNMGRQVAIYESAENVVVPYGASHIESAERVTHIMRKTDNDIKKLQASGFYRDIELDDPEPYSSDIEKTKAEDAGFDLSSDDRYALYEMHIDHVIPGVDDEDGIARPYIVTIEKSSGEVLSVYRNWVEDDVLHLKRQHFVHYVYIPGFGFYGLGLIHIIGGYARAGTSLIRQLVDAGTLSNLPGGLKARGLRIKGDDSPIEPGEFRDVDVPGGSIRENIMALPYKEPSQTLLALLNQITTEGRRLGAISDMNISDMSANAPVGTTLALLERTLKPMAAVQARVHYAMKQEFKLLRALMADNAPIDYEYKPERGENTARQADYAMVEVVPVSDPNNSTMAQRVIQYQTAMQMAQQTPQIYDLPLLHRQMLETIGIKNAEKIVPIQDDINPTDPVSENMNVLRSAPVKAFIHQDHEAHIQTHMTFMQDPMIAQTMGQNPMAQQMMGALHAHIAEHVAFRYRSQIEEKLGVMLPPPNEELNNDIEVNLARLVADAGKQVMEGHAQEAAQKQAQEQAQDPLMQLKQGELQTRQAEVQRKTAKDQTDAQLDAAELQRKIKKDATDAQEAAKKIALDEAELRIQSASNVRGEDNRMREKVFDTLNTNNQPQGRK